MMQQDQELLLDAWLRYHGHLFGFENLEILDNGSTDARVVSILRNYERAGCRIHWQFATSADFHQRHRHIEHIIRQWDASASYDIALPLECDEFVSVFTDQGLSCSRRLLHQYLGGLASEQRALGVFHALHSAPGLNGCFWSEHRQKGFLAANTIGSIDHAFRDVQSSRQPGTLHTRIASLRLHDRRLRRSGLPSTDLVADTNGEPSVADDKLLVLFPGFANLMSVLGIENDGLGIHSQGAGADTQDRVSLIYPPGLRSQRREIRPFDAETYLRLNEDVRAAGNAPLDHYLAFGFREGRHTEPPVRPQPMVAAPVLDKRSRIVKPARNNPQAPLVDLVAD